MLLMEVGETPYECGAFVMRHLPPWTLERRAGRRHGPVYILSPAIGDHGPGTPGGWIEAFQQAAILGHHPFTADEQPIVANKLISRLGQTGN